MGVGDPPSWEKALLYVVMAAILICCGGGALSLDNEILKPILLGLVS
jgi:putative oxidoreductase